MLILGCIFVPKILYDRATKQKDSDKGTVRISGLNESSAGFSDNGKSDRQTSAINEDRSSETIEPADFGERILTTKSQKELLQDLEHLQAKNDRMKKILQLEREKYQSLVEKISNSTETEGDPLECASLLKMPPDSHDISGKDDDPSTRQNQKNEHISTPQE